VKGDPLPDQDHISRYCSGIRITEDGRVTAAAFQLRTVDEYLSVNWLEFLGQPNREAEIKVIRGILDSKISLGAKAKIAVLDVGKMRDYIRQNSPTELEVRVLHQPEPIDPSHSGIFDVPHDDDFIPELIAGVIQETHFAKNR
jgi:hypothetical protein